MADGQKPCESHGAGLGNHVLLGDPALDEPVREAIPEGHQPAVENQVRVEGDEPRLALRLLDERLPVRGHEPLGRAGGATGRRLLRDELHRRDAERLEPAGETFLELGERALVLVVAGGAGVEAVEGRRLMGKPVGFHERNPCPLQRIGHQQLRSIGGGLRQPLQRAGHLRNVVAVAAIDGPAERRRLGLQLAKVGDLVHPGVRLDLVVIHDRGDLAHPLIRRAAQRLPELTLLKLAVPGEHEDASLPAGHAPGADEPLGLRDPHPERARGGLYLWGDDHVRVAWEPPEPAQPVDELEVQSAGAR